MRLIGIIIALGLILLMLIDAFETILQPRRITHRFRFARLFYRNTWKLWRLTALQIRPGSRREAFISIFGPLSLLSLFAMWIIGLMVGFAILQYSVATPMESPERRDDFATYLYLSGSTFVTLGYGDVTPLSTLGRALAVSEAALGFGFFAAMITYLPVLYQAYSRRESMISLMDARAGSPPSAAQFLLRLSRADNSAALDAFLAQWEQWAAELLESHLSFPVLSYYRSQHDNQSWLAMLTTILDVCTILIVQVKNHNSYRAQLTFAMARHTAVDLSLVLKASPRHVQTDRLPGERRTRMEQALLKAGLVLNSDDNVEQRLSELRGTYEPFVNTLADRFLLMLPPFVADEPIVDNWQRAPGMPRAPGIGSLPAAGGQTDGDHFG